MDEAIATDRDADVRDVPAFGSEEHQIAWFDLVEPYSCPHSVLIAHDAWNGEAVSREHVLNETAAVEALWIGAPRSVRDALQSERGAGNGESVGMREWDVDAGWPIRYVRGRVFRPGRHREWLGPRATGGAR